MREKVTVTVDDDHLGQVASLAEQLSTAGMEVEQVLGEIGIITGSAPAERRAALEGLAGVSAVESENSFQLPPSDSEVQ